MLSERAQLFEKCRVTLYRLDQRVLRSQPLTTTV